MRFKPYNIYSVGSIIPGKWKRYGIFWVHPWQEPSKLIIKFRRTIKNQYCDFQ